MQQTAASDYLSASPPVPSEPPESYYRARYYDPSSGRFLSEDPIAFQGGANFYTYVLNRPLNYVDPEGNIPLPLITAGIGALAGGIGDLAGQEISNFRQGKSLRNVDFKEVVVATGVGAAAGAAAPFVAVTWAGAAILGGLSNVTQMLILNRWENKCTTGSGLGLAFGLGALGGLVGGPTSTNKAFSTTSPYLDRGLAIRSNQSIQGATARANASRNIGAGLVSNLTSSSPDCGCN